MNQHRRENGASAKASSLQGKPVALMVIRDRPIGQQRRPADSRRSAGRAAFKKRDFSNPHEADRTQDHPAMRPADRDVPPAPRRCELATRAAIRLHRQRRRSRGNREHDVPRPPGRVVQPRRSCPRGRPETSTTSARNRLAVDLRDSLRRARRLGRRRSPAPVE